MNKKENIDTFGRNLKNIRQNKGLTQDKLSELSGVSRRMIGHYENEVKRPSIDKIKKLADALNSSIDELMGGQKFQKTNQKDDNLSYKLMKKLRLVEQLPTRDQNTVFSLINALAEKNQRRGE